MEKKKLVIGVIGADVHAVGIQILDHAFTEAGFDVTNLGVMVSQEEYIACGSGDGCGCDYGIFTVWSRRTGLPRIERKMQ